jgi:hypothetical protein
MVVLSYYGNIIIGGLALKSYERNWLSWMIY